jgi:hypothetical protein
MTIARIRSEPMPARIAALPVNKAGYPVPWFVAWIDGEPDFRVIGPGRIIEALRIARCWICGDLRSHRSSFVIGSMCAVNRVSSEPPSHLDCAIYAATHCPFLTKPKMHRRESRKPEGIVAASGVALDRNPGVALVWTSRTWRLVPDGVGGLLFDVGEPESVAWYAEGRQATRAEVLTSIGSGLPLLREVADEDGPEAVAELTQMHERALALVPA